MGGPELLEALSYFPVNLGSLAELRRWRKLVAPNQERDLYGDAYAKFAAAHAIISVVLRPTALDASAPLPSGVERIMQTAADALADIGASQFAVLSRVAWELSEWVILRAFRSVALIESPIGNSLPVQVIYDVLKKRGLAASIVTLKAPRNERTAKGRTITNAATSLAEDLMGFECVVFIDDVLTGGRFSKLFDALQPVIEPNRFVAIAMAFEAQRTLSPFQMNNREKAKVLVEDQGKISGYPKPWQEFPSLPRFSLNGDGFVRWQDAMIWGYFDILSGQRKVNLVFDLIDHAHDILLDLGNIESVFRPYLERAWAQDIKGVRYQFAPGLLQNFFQNTSAELNLKEFRKALRELAKSAFPKDYRGEILSAEEVDVPERINWLSSRFVNEAQKILGEERANCLRNAVFAVFDASFPEKEPEVDRDTSAAQYVLPYHPVLRALNRRLRERIVEAAEQGWHFPALFMWRSRTHTD
jgi:hypothetical protein